MFKLVRLMAMIPVLLAAVACSSMNTSTSALRSPGHHVLSWNRKRVMHIGHWLRQRQRRGNWRPRQLPSSCFRTS